MIPPRYPLLQQAKCEEEERAECEEEESMRKAKQIKAKAQEVGGWSRMETAERARTNKSPMGR